MLLNIPVRSDAQSVSIYYANLTVLLDEREILDQELER